MSKTGWAVIGVVLAAALYVGSVYLPDAGEELKMLAGIVLGLFGYQLPTKARGNGLANSPLPLVLLGLLPALATVESGCGHGPALERVAEKAAPLLIELAKQRGMLLDKGGAICAPLPEEASPDEDGIFVVCYAPGAE